MLESLAFRNFYTSGGQPAGDASGLVVFNHIPGGCNVLYMDGHVEFVRYGTKTPIWQGAENSWGYRCRGVVGLSGGFG